MNSLNAEKLESGVRMPHQKKRNHCVSVRVNSEELDLLDGVRGRLQRGAAMRLLSFSFLPQPVPELNLKAWQELSKSAGNLNQVAHKLNSGELLEIEEIRTALSSFRAKLLGE